MRAAAEPLECVVESHRDTIVIRPIGELDIATAPGFARTCQEPARSGFPRVVLDLRELEFCDSSGLRVILDLQQFVPTGTRFDVIPGPAAIQRLLAISGIETSLSFVDARDVGL